MTDEKDKKLALRLSLTYVLVAIAWVIISDFVTFNFFDPAQNNSNQLVHSIKEVLFVIITGFILYAVLKASFGNSERERLRRELNQRLLTSQAEILESVTSGVPLNDSLKRLAQLSEKEIPGSLVLVSILSDDRTLRHGASPSLPESFGKALDGVATHSGDAAGFSKLPVISKDIVTDPVWENRRDLMATHGLKACWSYPILDSDQNFIGSLSLYFRTTTSDPDAEQNRLIKSVTHTAAIAIGRFRAEKIRIESEQRYRILTDQAADAFFVQDDNGMFIEVNRRACEYLGYSREELLQMQASDIEKDFDAKGWLDMLRMLRPGQVKTVIGQHQRKDGTRFPVEIRLGSFETDGKVIYHALSRDITDRKRAADALEMFRTLVDRVNDSIEVIDPETGRFLDINEKACVDLGYSREEMLSLSVMDVDPSQDVAGFKTLREKLWDTGALMAESTYRRKDGSTFPVEVNMKWVWLDRDYVVAVVRDITERKRNEEALRASEHQFASLVNNIDGIVWEADFNGGKMTFVSYQAQRILGYPITQWLEESRFWENHIHPDDREEIIARSYASTQRGEGHDAEYRMIASDGRAVWIHDFVSVVEEAGKGKVLRGVMVDVTDRKNAEAEIQTRDKRFRLMIENASDIITVLNAKGSVSFQSPAAIRIMGYRPDEMNNTSIFGIVHPDDLARFKTTFGNAITHPGLAVSAEWRYKHGDGSWRFMQTVARSVEGESPDGFIVANSRDITETRRLEEQFRQSQKMEAIGQLAGGVAHDLNNILTVVHMQLDLLKYGDPLTPTQSESVLDIEKASRRAADLTRQLLMFSRRQAAMKHDIDLNAVVTNITKMLQRILGEDVAMHISYAPQPLPVHADSGMLDQILLNLAVNSRDAMPAGGKLVIETSAAELDEFAASQKPNARVGRFACLTVSDSGRGIPPEVLPRIFEPFFTTKDIGKGTGLGLATVFGIVQQHNGWINAYSEVGQGTTFRMYLPLQKQAEEVITEKTPDAKGGNETILLVEDEQSLRVLVRNVLTRLGYRVLEATTGLTAVEVWKENRKDIRLLLTDLVMPDGMTGKQLGEVLTAENPDLKVIYTSGYSRDIAGQGFTLQDGVNFLSKPFQAAKLAQTVRNSLDSATESSG